MWSLFVALDAAPDGRQPVIALHQGLAALDGEAYDVAEGGAIAELRHWAWPHQAREGRHPLDLDLRHHHCLRIRCRRAP